MMGRSPVELNFVLRNEIAMERSGHIKLTCYPRTAWSMVRNQGHSKCTWTIISATASVYKLMRNGLKLQISYENRFAFFLSSFSPPSALFVFFSFLLKRMLRQCVSACVCVQSAHSLVASSVILCHCAFCVSYWWGFAVYWCIAAPSAVQNRLFCLLIVIIMVIMTDIFIF